MSIDLQAENDADDLDDLETSEELWFGFERQPEAVLPVQLR